MSGSWMGGSGFGGDEDDPPFQYDPATAGRTDGRTVDIEGSAVPTFAEAKDPIDHIDYALGMDSLLSKGETVATIDLVTSARLDGTFSNADLDVRAAFGVGRYVVIWVTDGEPGVRYRLGARFTTSRGRQLRRFAIVTVKDRSA